MGFSIGFERVCGILLEQGYQIPGAKQKIALLYGKDADFPAVLAKAAALRDTYNVTVLPQLADGHTHLLHGVAVADGDAVVGRRALSSPTVSKSTVMQYGRADLVLTAVTLADGTGIVVVHHEVLGQLAADLHGLLAQLLAQGQHGALVGRQSRMQMQHGADILLALAVGPRPPRRRLRTGRPAPHGRAQRRLDDVGDVVLVGLGVEVAQILAGGF